MPRSVIETYSELWHYTTAEGLKGIINDQQLWATNIFYLNDVEEYTGFFNRKLLNLLEEGANEGAGILFNSESGKKLIDQRGGVEFLKNQLPQILRKAMREATLKRPAYVASFCSTPSEQPSENGLLSQWRGYGADGGYAIVFDTTNLNSLLDVEFQSYIYSFFHWGDVDYFDENIEGAEAYEEVLEWENTIRKCVSDLIQVPPPKLEFPEEIGNKLFVPIFSLATRHKHRGFREEREVRIVVVPAESEEIEASRAKGDTRSIKAIRFFRRDGILVPYLPLFENKGDQSRLPIKKIVIGPHPDKLKRKMSVEILLKQLKIDASVEVSEIPYIGR